MPSPLEVPPTFFQSIGTASDCLLGGYSIGGGPFLKGAVSVKVMGKAQKRRMLLFFFGRGSGEGMVGGAGFFCLGTD